MITFCIWSNNESDDICTHIMTQGIMWRVHLQMHTTVCDQDCSTRSVWHPLLRRRFTWRHLSVLVNMSRNLQPTQAFSTDSGIERDGTCTCWHQILTTEYAKRWTPWTPNMCLWTSTIFVLPLMITVHQLMSINWLMLLMRRRTCWFDWFDDEWWLWGWFLYSLRWWWPIRWLFSLITVIRWFVDSLMLLMLSLLLLLL